MESSQCGIEMKVAMLSPYYNIIYRGAEQFGEHLQQALKPLGYDIDIIGADSFIPFIKSWENYISASYIGSFFKKYVGIEPSLFYALYIKNLKKHNFCSYDMIWGNSEFIVAQFAKQISKKYGTPFILSSHSNKSKLLKKLAKLYPDLLAVLTPEYQHYLNGTKGNIKCIHSGVDTDLFNPMQISKQQMPERPWFLSTASLTPAKRIHLIIDAISKLKKGSLIFTSSGPEKEKLLAMAEKKIPCRYEYLGPVKSEQLPAIYNFCDYYVNASVSEGLSTSIAEAMACNLPVVYQKDENRNWQIDGAGIGCNVTDTNEFALALTAVVNDSFGNIPRQQAEKFSLKHSAKLYDEEIKKIL